MRPSEYVQRQVRVTPYPHEDTGWTIANAGADVCMFSSDFPHVEGGRNPIARFERSMDAAGIDADARRALLLSTTSSTCWVRCSSAAASRSDAGAAYDRGCAVARRGARRRGRRRCRRRRAPLPGPARC